MIHIAIYYVISVGLLGFYGEQVGPFLESLGKFALLRTLLIAVVLLLPLRLYLYHKRRNSYRSPDLLGQSFVFSLPVKEFFSDLFLWVGIAVGVSLFHTIFYRFPLLVSGGRLLIGCMSAGLFNGMFSFLAMEREGILGLQQHPVRPEAPHRLGISVSQRMLFFSTSIVVSTGIITVLMVVKDIQDLLTNQQVLSVTHLRDILLESFLVLLTVFSAGFGIIFSFAKNMKMLFSAQIAVLKEVGAGKYHTYVPVATNDEFGVIAEQTNRMIDGLKERNFIRETFGKYVSKELSEAILSGRVALEGQIQEVTLLFSDLRGFTAFAEALNPKEVMRTLNQYFTEMDQAIRNHQGLILQFVGDGIEAVFGELCSCAEHPQQAVKASLEMRQRLEKLNAIRSVEGKPTLRHGIGIHSGPVMAGNVGSGDRLSYALVGDTVNFASRIEQLTKDLHWDILLSQSTMERVEHKFRVEKLPSIAVRGKTAEQIVWKLLGENNPDATASVPGG